MLLYHCSPRGNLELRHGLNLYLFFSDNIVCKNRFSIYIRTHFWNAQSVPQFFSLWGLKWKPIVQLKKEHQNPPSSTTLCCYSQCDKWFFARVWRIRDFSCFTSSLVCLPLRCLLPLTLAYFVFSSLLLSRDINYYAFSYTFYFWAFVIWCKHFILDIFSFIGIISLFNWFLVTAFLSAPILRMTNTNLGCFHMIFYTMTESDFAAVRIINTSLYFISKFIVLCIVTRIPSCCIHGLGEPRQFFHWERAYERFTFFLIFFNYDIYFRN